MSWNPAAHDAYTIVDPSMARTELHSPDERQTHEHKVQSYSADGSPTVLYQYHPHVIPEVKEEDREDLKGETQTER